MRFRAPFLTALLVFVVFLAAPARAASTATDLQSQLSAHTAEIDQLNAQIAKYEAAIQQANADKATLHNAINTLELQKQKVQTQISVTQNQIAATQIQITQLGSQIDSIESLITTDQAALAVDLRSVAQNDEQPLIAQLLSSDSLASAWQDADAVAQVNRAIQGDVASLSAQRDALASARSQSQDKQVALTSQKQTLSAQQTSLSRTTKQKTQLLAETNASEAEYQKLLAQAKAELASFSTFAQNAGGSGLLSNQTSCDSWGCYYNQRDSQWGNDPLDGTQYRLKSDGCLITSMAMVMTHYGYRNVTPVTINSDPGNFAAYYPAYLLMTINVDGMSVTRKSAYISSTLASGNPVVVGIYAYGGTHYVVLTKASGGGYLMRDPYVPNGKDIQFTSHYSLKNVFSVAKVIIS